jgi:putative FmdB family regulatory protein
MPIYEYRCTACGHELEALQKLSEPALTTCPSCRTDGLAKQVSAAGFQLKGSGWYVTDFRNGSKPAAKSKTDGESKGEPKSDTKSESKTESKGDSKGESKPAAAGACGAGCACH